MRSRRARTAPDERPRRSRLPLPPGWALGARRTCRPGRNWLHTTRRSSGDRVAQLRPGGVRLCRARLLSNPISAAASYLSNDAGTDKGYGIGGDIFWVFVSRSGLAILIGPNA